MATVNEQIVTGRAYRVLIDKATKLWQKISFWTKGSDVEFNDGNTAETKVGAIDGITDSLVSTSSRIAASAKSVATLNNNLDGCSLERREDGVYITYTPPGGADPVSKKLGKPTVADIQTFNTGNATYSGSRNGIWHTLWEIDLADLNSLRVNFSQSSYSGNSSAGLYLNDTPAASGDYDLSDFGDTLIVKVLVRSNPSGSEYCAASVNVSLTLI